MAQLDMFGDNENDNTFPKIGLNKITNGEFIYLPEFFSKSESDFYLKELSEKVLWKQESMNMYGKTIDFPRLTAWYGDNDKPYSFSGITLSPTAWNEEIFAIKNKIETESKVIFNSVLLNRYRSGSDSISWHTDAEKELGENPIIASANFGETRKFQLRHIETKEKLEIALKHGSLLIMQGELQHHWQHQVPKSTKPLKERINLTFRVIL
jgi:alkylated DNA repair dioxygenase AlkB